MRRIPRRLPALIVPLLAVTAPALAQEPETNPPATEAHATSPEQSPPQRPRPDGARRPGGRRQTIAIQAGHIHPVNGPEIENGTILVRGDRIVAIGKTGEVEVPENAQIRTFPDGHVYPGLIDARTDAFTDPAVANAGLDFGITIADDLQERHTRDDQLAAAGITTAYVSGRGGQGAIVRPTANGFEVWDGKRSAAVQMRMTNGPVPTHALQRQQQLDQQQKAFDGLEGWRKAKEEHDKALDKYNQDFEDYLAFHKKKSGGAAGGSTAPAGGNQPATGTEGAPAESGARGPGSGRPRGRRGPPQPGGGGQAADPKAAELEAAVGQLLDILATEVAAEDHLTSSDPQDPPTRQEPRPQGQGGQPQGGSGGAPGAQGGAQQGSEPKRPTYPKAPPENPAFEALQKVLDGTLPLRVEAHRPDELRAALAMQKAQHIPLLVLEQAYGADAVAADLAKAGAMVVLTDVLPGPMPKLYEAFSPTQLPQKLEAAGVPFAIATGSARQADLLPQMAATAVGNGLSADAALRAITLSAAEILGVQQDTGSLQTGKLADLCVFDRPLFASDSRVLFVLGRGQTQFEAK